MTNITEFVNRIRRLTRSLYWNLKLLPFKQAIRLPIIVGKHVKITSHGNIIFDIPLKQGILYLGRWGSPALPEFRYTNLLIKSGGTLRIKGHTFIGEGSSIVIERDAEIAINGKFSCNRNCLIKSAKKITFGDNCLLGWNVTVNDTDGHYVFDEEMRYEDPHGEIEIGDHVWIAADVVVHKNSFIASDCIVGQKSLVRGRFTEPKCLIAGHPARKIKKIGGWKH